MSKEEGKHNVDERRKRKQQQTALTTITENVETMQGGMQEVLPIVELKPFLKKVWRREKSLPEFYLKLQAQTADENVDCRRLPNVSRENSHHTDSCDTKGLRLPCTPNPSYLESRFNVDTSSRNRTKIHPSTQFSYNCRPQKSPHFIPGFITRAERTKTTLEITHKWEDDASKSSSNLNESLSEKNGAGRQCIHGQGDKLKENISIKQLFYLNPRAGNNSPRSVNGYHSNPESPFKKANVSFGLYGEEKDKYYVSPALSEGEPSKSILWGRKHFKSPMKQIKYDKNTDTSFRQSGHIHIGRIKNAFQILNNRGRPTNVERKLTFELELRLQECRRLTEFKSTSEFVAPATHHPVSLCSNETDTLASLTRGEVMLLHGREANRRKRQASGLSSSHDNMDFDRNMRKMAAVQMEIGELPTGKLERIEDSFQSIAFERSDKTSISDAGSKTKSSGNPMWKLERIESSLPPAILENTKQKPIVLPANPSQSPSKVERMEESFQSTVYENSDKNSISGTSTKPHNICNLVREEDSNISDEEANKEKDGGRSGRSSVEEQGRGMETGSEKPVLILPKIKNSSEFGGGQNNKPSGSSTSSQNGTSSALANEDPTDGSMQKSTQTDNSLLLPKASLTSEKPGSDKTSYSRDKKGRSYNNFDVRSKAFVTSP